MSGSSASPIVSRSTSFSFSASGSAMPWLSLSSRTASGSSVPAAADEPSSERPKRAPSSSAQSISLSVTAGVSPLCRAGPPAPRSTPRQPSSQPPCGTASMCEPTTTILSRLARDRRPQVPGDVALDRRVGLGELAEQPLARRPPVLAPREPARPVGPPGQLRQLVQVLERPLPVEVRHARKIGATREPRAGFLVRMIRWRRIIGVSAALFCLLAPGAQARTSPFAKAALVSCDRDAREAVFEGRVPDRQAGGEDAAALHAAGADAGRRRRWRKVDARRLRRRGSPRRAAFAKYTYDKTVAGPARARQLPRGRRLPLARPRAARRCGPSGRSRRSASSPTRGRTCVVRNVARRPRRLRRGGLQPRPRGGRARSTSTSSRRHAARARVEVAGLAPQAPVT